jgi:hypothetical protein
VPNYSEFVAVYRTDILEPPFGKFIVPPVKVEIVVGPKRLQVPVFLGRSLPAGKERLLTAERELVLPTGATYLLVTTRVEAKDPYHAEEEGRDSLDRVLATLAVLYTPDLLSEPLYRGFLASGNTRQFSGWIRLTKPFSLDGNDATAAIGKARRRLAEDPDIERRFGLMARFLTKAVAYPPCEERFVLLWTILEVFPMKDTSDITPISAYLHDLTGHPTAELKDRLGIGRLFGARSKLVHDGTLPIAISEMGEVFGRLEAICRVVIRGVAGFSYDGSLEPHFSMPKDTSV